MRPSAHFWKPTEVLEFAGALRSDRELVRRAILTSQTRAVQDGRVDASVLRPPKPVTRSFQVIKLGF